MNSRITLALLSALFLVALCLSFVEASWKPHSRLSLARDHHEEDEGEDNDEPEEALENEELSVHLMNSAKVKFSHVGDSKMFLLSFLGIQENNGGPSFNNFASLDSYFGDVDRNHSFHGLQTLRVDFHSDLPLPAPSPSASLDVWYYLFLEAGNYSVHEQRFDVDVNSMKFTVLLSNWTFASANPDASVTFRMNLLVPSGRPSWDAETRTLSTGNLRAQFAEEAEYDEDGNWGEVGVDVVIRGSNAEIALTFGRFDSWVRYDPQFSVEGEGSSAPSLRSFLF
ncbi:hypothetical protein QOT17_007564 [Balamuthia mandrillaris]